MKQCPACGNEYADNVRLCPVDGRRLVPGGTDGSTTTPALPANAFDVKMVSPILSAGTYRIFVERSDLIFIQLQGGSRSILEAAGPFLGPFGAVIPLALWLFTRGKAKVEREHLETGDPEVLLRENGGNFKLHQAEIREAAIEAPTVFATSGKAGRLNLRVRHGEKIRCEFENTNEMNRAIQLLVPLLNPTLKINVKWNGEKQRFEKRKALGI
jgi:hypothetical protein